MIDSVLGESLNETDMNVFEEGEEEQRDEQQHKEEMLLEEIIEDDGEEENYGEEKISYIDMQAEIILSNIERKLMWDKYKYYVDEIVFMGLRDTTLCRYVLQIIKLYLFTAISNNNVY